MEAEEVILNAIDNLMICYGIIATFTFKECPWVETPSFSCVRINKVISSYPVLDIIWDVQYDIDT